LSNRVRASWWVGAVAVLLLTPLAFSQNSVSITLDNGGPYSMGGLSVGPFNATQSVNNGPQQSVQIICDDFRHNVQRNESWTANITSVTSLTNATTGLAWSGYNAGGSALFGFGYKGNETFTALQGYLAMAYLASEMLPLSGNKGNATEVGYMAYAIWAIFDASAVKSWLNGHGAGNIWSQVQSLAEGALALAYNKNITQSQFAGWEILTPDCSKHGSCPLGTPQEFFEYVPVPEGGTAVMYLLLAGFACFGTMYFKSRRRHASGVV